MICNKGIRQSLLQQGAYLSEPKQSLTSLVQNSGSENTAGPPLIGRMWGNWTGFKTISKLLILERHCGETPDVQRRLLG